jgi:hypothetical protein
VLVLTLASHLAWVGPGAYAQDFMAARHRVWAAYRGGIEVIHGIPILVSGVNDGAAVEAIEDFFLWLRQVATGRNVSDTVKLFIEKILPAAGNANIAGLPLAPDETAASPSAAVSYRLLLPSDMSGN